MPSTEDIQPCDHAAGEGQGVSVDETLLEGAVVTITSRFSEKLIQAPPELEPGHTVVVDITDEGAKETIVAALNRVDQGLISAGIMLNGTIMHIGHSSPWLVPIVSSSSREDSRVQAFRDRARIFIIPRPEPASMGQRLDMGLTVRMRGGAVLRQELRYPLMTAAELQQKFRDLVGLRLESRRVADLERQLQAIGSVENVAPLIHALELDS